VSPVLAQTTLPDDNTGYVAAAYLVLFALVFAYFAIMAVKLARIERELVELNALADRPAGAAQDGSEPGGAPAASAEPVRRVPAS
jgi:CcmD family protein